MAEQNRIKEIPENELTTEQKKVIEDLRRVHLVRRHRQGGASAGCIHKSRVAPMHFIIRGFRN